MPGWRLWQNCHFHHICQIRQYRQLLWAPLLLCALPCRPMCQNCHFRYICQICQYRQIYGLPHCFVLCLVADCGNIVIFAVYAKFAIMFSFLPFLLLRAFLDISHDFLSKSSHFSEKNFPENKSNPPPENKLSSLFIWYKAMFQPYLWVHEKRLKFA